MTANKTTVSTTPEEITPFTDAIGPGFPTIPLISINPIIIAKTQNNKVKFVSSVTFTGKWLAASIQRSIGIENNVFVLDANPALAVESAASDKVSPPSATWLVEAITTCCLGQIINQTFRNIRVPKTLPVNIIIPQDDK